MYNLGTRYYDAEIGRFINADGYVSTGQGVLGYNMFAYCLNNPINALDLDGEDAVWLQDKNSVWSFGHTGLLIQNENEEWYHIYWGANGSDSSGKGGAKAKIKKLTNFEYDNLTSLNTYLKKQKKKIYSGTYEDAIYSKGDFKYNDKGFTKKLKNIREIVIPNIAFRSLTKYYKNQLLEKYSY